MSIITAAHNSESELENFEATFDRIQVEASSRLRALHREYLGKMVDDAPQRLHPWANMCFFRVDAIKLYDHLDPDMMQVAIQETLHKIITSLSNLKEKITFLILGESSRVRFYMGIESSSEADSGKHEVLRSSLEGNYPGSQLYELNDDETVSLRRKLRTYDHSSVMTGIPLVYRNGDRQMYCADTLLRGMYGQEFAYLVVAKPVPQTDIEVMENFLVEEIKDFQGYIKSTVSTQKSKGESNALTKTISAGVFFAQTLALQYGANISVTCGGPLSPVHVTVGVSGGISTALTGGVQAGVGLSATNTVSSGESRSISEDLINKKAEVYRNNLDVHLRRVLQAKNGQGMWMTTCYLLSNDYSSHRRMESLLLGGFSDDFGHPESLRVTGFRKRRGLSEVASEFDLLGNTPERSQCLSALFPYKFCTPLLSSELSVFFNLPREDFPGFKVKKVPKFSVNPLYGDEGCLTLGVVCDRDSPLEMLPFGIPKDELTKHAFVGGITGSGKTNTIFTILSGIQDTPFLVIEPAKNEYRELANSPKFCEALSVYVLGDIDEDRKIFRLNPFEFLPGDNIQAHIDGLKSVFNASFPLWGPLPYILEICLQRIYEEYGWDVFHNRHNKYDTSRSIDASLFPTLASFTDCVDRYVEESGYSREVKDNIKGSLQVRLNSLCVGNKGFMLNVEKSYPSIEVLLNSPVVIELKSIGDDDDKVFIMALLLIRIHRYLILCNNDNAAFLNTKLKHLLVIEEAHRLFRKATSTDGVERADLRSKAVENFENIMAEIRAYGMGVVIVDQIPSKIADGAIKNTNLKIAHRLTSMDDMEVIGNACCLNSSETAYLSALGVGRAVVHAAMMDKAANVAMPDIKPNFAPKKLAAPKTLFLEPASQVLRPLRAATFVETLYGKYRDPLVDIANRHLPTLWYSSLVRVHASHLICIDTIKGMMLSSGDLHDACDDIKYDEVSQALLSKALCEILEGKFYLQGKRTEVAQIQRAISALTQSQFQGDPPLREIQKLIGVIGRRLRMSNELGLKDLENVNDIDPFIPEAILFWRNHWNDASWVDFDFGTMGLAKQKEIFQQLVHINDFEGEPIKNFFRTLAILSRHQVA